MNELKKYHKLLYDIIVDLHDMIQKVIKRLGYDDIITYRWIHINNDIVHMIWYHTYDIVYDNNDIIYYYDMILYVMLMGS